MKRWPQDADMLCRSDLEQGRMREVYLEAVAAGRALDDEQLSTSLMATLAERPKGAGWWVFAYGSLLWNPLFPVAEMRPATLRGLHRRFCLWSVASRGTPEEPGLVLGLERGGTCRGIALRLPAPLALDELHLLWRREMVVGAYQPRWVNLDADGRHLVALTFVVRRDHPQYAGRLPIAKQVEVISKARGAFGASADYLERARVALVSHGIVDPYLEQLATKIVRAGGRPPTPREAEAGS
jgi:glutathione-specific gamma-glutamylcyclotransferase